MAENLRDSLFAAIEGEPMDARFYPLIDNGRCLALQGACFACIDHCLQEAVSMALGRGIVIDSELCNGCGECATVCPINQKSISAEVERSRVNQTYGKER